MDDRRSPYRKLDLELISSFLNGRVVSSSERIKTGKANTNYKLVLSDGQTVVFRLYSPNGINSPAREARIARLIAGRVPIPAILDYGDDWAMFEFVPGVTLESATECIGAAAEALTHLFAIKFDTGGWIQPDGSVTPFDFGDDYVGSILEKPEITRWVDRGLAQTVKAVLRRESGRLSEIRDQHVLVHGDFNPTNILVESGRVSAIVDWEWAHVGVPYMDIGNLLRNIDPQFHGVVHSGLQAGGFDVPGDWKERAALVDIGSHFELLTSGLSDDFKRSRVRLIQEFVRMFGG